MKTIDPMFFRRIKSGLERLSAAQRIGIFLLVSIDLVVKFSLEARLEAWRGSVLVFPGFNLTLGHNRGVSFGVLDSDHWIAPYLLSSVAVVLVAAVLIWSAQQRSKLVNAAGILFASGGLANAIDRLGDGAVTDYLDFGWQALRWPTFNLADVFIFIGVALLLAGWRTNSQNLDGDGQ
jgi:signal peptidase II